MAQTPDTLSARGVAQLIRKTWPHLRSYTDKDVRSLTRAGIVPRLAEQPESGGNRSHVYQRHEVRLLLEAVAARHLKRTGQTLKVPAPYANASVPRTRKTAPSRRKTRKTAPTTAPSANAAQAPSEAPTGDAS